MEDVMGSPWQGTRSKGEVEWTVEWQRLYGRENVAPETKKTEEHFRGGVLETAWLNTGEYMNGGAPKNTMNM
eukprot:1140536-Pelagomonas_calceolata.AAC.6